jgi:hypothetical protein
LQGRRAELSVASAILVALAFATYFPILRFGLLGIDSYPILLTSVVDGPGDLVRLWAQPMMGGRFWADFYRPVSGLVMSLDHALWGLDAFGFQLTSLIVFAACACLLYAWVARLAGRATLAAPLAAGIFVLLPSHYEVLPVPARRPEILASLLSLLSLWLLLRPRSLERVRPAWAAGAVALLAIGAKETALLLPLLAFAAVALYSPRRGLRERAVQAAVASVPFVLALAVATGARIGVLGSLGGHGDSNAGMVHLPRALDMGLALLHPQQTLLPPWASGWLELAGLAALLLAGGLGLPRLASLSPPDPARSTRVRAGLLAGLWLAAMLLLHAYTGKWNSWYLFFPSIGFAWLAGVLLDGLGATALRPGPLPLRLASAAGGLGLAALVAWQLGYSPLLYRYPEWPLASEAQQTYLEHTAELIRAARPGSVLEPGPFPQRASAGSVLPERGRAKIRGAAILYVHSIQAWAELRFPDRSVRVVIAEVPGQPLPPALRDWAQRQGNLRPPGPDEIVLRVPHAGRRVVAPAPSSAP